MSNLRTIQIAPKPRLFTPRPRGRKPDIVGRPKGVSPYHHTFYFAGHIPLTYAQWGRLREIGESRVMGWQPTALKDLVK